MNKVMKIALIGGAMLAISFTIGCGTDDGESWCVGEFGDSAITKELKACYKIYPESEYYWAKSETACKLAGVANSNIKVTGRPNKSECLGGWDDGSKK